MPCQTCQTCLSDLRGAPAFVPPCCGAPVCAGCVGANPRLATWVPCLRCGAAGKDPRDAKEPKDPAGIKVTRVAGRPRTTRKEEEEEKEGQFVLVGDSDEETEGEDWEGVAGGEGGEGKEEKDEPEIVEITHVPRRGETLLSIARQYATDPHSILALNDLPHAALYANPRLIGTRPRLVISRRLINVKGESADVMETEERRAQRAVARFQAVAKAEEGVARAYLALHPGSPPGSGSSSASASATQRSGREGQGPEVLFNFDDEKKREGQDAALEHYFDDEAWEAGAPKPARGSRGRGGRWTVVGAVLPSGVREKK
ncbi:hypothetical protein CspeluHIS016_0114890 [Cutaneotrichosporon spelunceum]|uniref:LysM domain-containing protein n=1 Tax=Cutaneotrichosporon spelunceum TaxID=1672016 RepID=A0AAD3TQM2_9TREE|nr:hypothetical protein CspeluHIS016_0114890 [Cutaneotrichosporon spelunceum]